MKHGLRYQRRLWHAKNDWKVQVLNSCQLIHHGGTTTRTKFTAIVNSEWLVSIVEGFDV
jgi:hypothetical protein